jgi:hypothetical protein
LSSSGAEFLRVQLVAKVSQRVGFSVAVRGEGGQSGGGEVRALEADIGQLGVESADVGREGGDAG